MKNDVSFLGVGQAGGNIARLFENAGYTAMYIDTSLGGLDTLGKTKYMYHVTGAEGSGCDRNVSKRLTTGQWEKINDFISDKLTTQFIFVVFSAGGGTGSGSSPLLIENLIQAHPDKRICAIVVFPAYQESLQAHANAVECINELNDIEGLAAIFALDNNAWDKEKINTEFVNQLDAVLTLPGLKDIGAVIDNADLKRVLSASGYSVIARLPKEQSAIDKLINAVKSGLYVPMENDQLIEYILLAASSAMDVNKIKEIVGEPLITFTADNPSQTLCLLTGLSAPTNRISEMSKYVNDVNEKRQKAREQKKIVPKTEIKVVEYLSERPPVKKISTDDLFAKYKVKK